MNNEQFEDEQIERDNAGTVERDTLARAEADRDTATRVLARQIDKSAAVIVERDTVKALLAKAVRLLDMSKFQLMLWEDYQVLDGFEVEDHDLTGRVRQEVEAFLTDHAQAEQQEAQPARVVFDEWRAKQEEQGAQGGDFQREDRYIVIKRKDLELAPFADRVRSGAAGFLLSQYLPKREYLVIESDWPEYEPTWEAIQARVEGRAALATQPAAEQLWAVHAQGPDELYAAFSREEAEAHAAALNALPCPPGISVSAVVIESPWPAAEHWKYLVDQDRENNNAAVRGTEHD